MEDIQMMEQELARDFEKELGVPSSVAQNTALDVTNRVRLKLINPACPKCSGKFTKPLEVGEKCNAFFVETSFQ